MSDDALIARLNEWTYVQPKLRADLDEAAARLREQQELLETLAMTGEATSYQLIELTRQLATAESRAKALHDALRQHVILCGHSEAPGRCFVCGNIWEVLDEDHAEGCLAAPEGSV